ncbi:MAG TPA: ATP-binding cassette domain-containing protein, partial [Dongiaceae bacterium]|nr:ATP-binding cassette domain-containing protein [Dongiaceae bacterium]
MAPKLQITGLSKTFETGGRRVEALRDIELTLADNEFVSLVGTSGCGKSTLL